ncbi:MULTISPECIES: PEGA domain-containing protein [unclassified Methanoregula]|uniref:PEGA domain-containing protein n=1 Tax=unclassified Methanoregula TaxID=2649730 RepID=UPI0009D00B81|nr:MULTISPECIES: PEGA domain-containing protein [unclassified Methanoregula]OPX65058.1 MAG: PEGA domain protein [Methanoregula sp. PtaB.Bin085]OPY32339.1 MAG: PEGA domain protein [Methanoregula sp. PtaU1.Bin006]
MKNVMLPCILISVLFLVMLPVTGEMIGGGEGWIRVDCNVDGAAVSFNGEYKGVTSGGSLTVPVYTTATPYSAITVSKSGYTTYSGGLTMPTEGQTVTVYATLNPIYSPTTSPPVRTGSISVESSPAGADIYLDGSYRGRAPLTISGLWPGDYTVSAEMSGYRTFTTTTSISPDTHSSVYCPLSPISSSGALYILSTPSDATVMLDGMYKGRTPLTISNVAAGTHLLQLDSPNYYDWKSTVEVPEGGTRTVSATLNPMPSSSTGWIYVSSSPGGASVTLDGNAVGQTPSSGSLKLNSVAAGDHTVVLDRAGYKRYTVRTSVSPNTVSEVSAVMVPESAPSGTGSLSVSSSPSGANILVDNNFIGISPLTAHDIAVGEHLVTFRMDGYQDYSTSALVNAGTTSTVSAALLPVTPAPKSPAFVLTVLLALGILGFIVSGKPE